MTRSHEPLVFVQNCGAAGWERAGDDPGEQYHPRGPHAGPAGYTEDDGPELVSCPHHLAWDNCTSIGSSHLSITFVFIMD